MATVISEAFVQELLPARNPYAHKGNFGRVLLLCGSVGYTGAASLAAKAAARTGSGLIFLGTPLEVYPILAQKLDEPMVFPLPCEDGKFSTSAASAIVERLESKDAVLIGPGMGVSEGTFACVKAVLQKAKCPVVLDADGINVLAGHTHLLRECACPVILTPHPGEFLRLGGNTEASREEAAISLAKELGVICVLKGHETVVSDGACCYVNSTGNPGMATGGSGDVLAGMMVSLLGQGIAPLQAACAAVWLHGKAGDICAEEIGQYGMLPSDMLQVIPRLLP